MIEADNPYLILRRPPITEAVIDFRVESKSTSAAENLVRMQGELASRYYLKSPIHQRFFAFELGVETGSQQHPTQETIGVRLHSKDEKYVIQATSTGIGISRLEPYEDWATFAAEAKIVWTVFSTLVGVNKIKRVAVRYINNLLLPIKPNEDISDYLTAGPQIASGLPGKMNAFVQRVVVQDPNTENFAAITHSYDSQPPNDDGLVPVILDIDVFTDCNLDPRDVKVWSKLEQLRSFKNMIFFKNLTDQALSLYR